MKKLAAILLIALIALPGVALAEGLEIPAKTMFEAISGETYSFWGEPVRVEFAFQPETDSGAALCQLRVGNAQVTIEGWYFEEKVYLAKLDGYTPYAVVFDYGPSDDPVITIFSYDPYSGTLSEVGAAPTRPDTITFNNDGTFTGVVRASALYTWSRAADFVIAKGYMYDENYDTINVAPVVIEAPRASYAMGAIAFPKLDIPVYTSTDFNAVAFTARAGERLIFVSTDDKTWVYVCTDGEYGFKGGYVQLDPENVWSAILVNGQSVNGWENLPGLLYAD